MDLKRNESPSLKIWPSGIPFFLIFLVLSFLPLISTWSVFFSSGHIQHPHERLSVILINLFCVAGFLNFIVGLDCRDDELRVWRFFITLKVPWKEIEKIEFIFEGKSLAIIKIFYDKPFLGQPIKLLLRTFPREKVALLSELIKKKALNAQIENVELWKSNFAGLKK